MKPGKEVARFEHRGMPSDQGRVYQASLRECGSTLYRCHTPKAKVTNAWRRVRGWAVKFKTLRGREG